MADEMGLGKSLVILSVIAGSLDEARRFGAQKTPQQIRTPSKATLIIVPSTCKPGKYYMTSDCQVGYS